MSIQCLDTFCVHCQRDRNVGRCNTRNEVLTRYPLPKCGMYVRGLPSSFNSTNQPARPDRFLQFALDQLVARIDLEVVSGSILHHACTGEI